MSAAKKRDIYNEGTVFNNEWCSKYIVVPHNQCAVCCVCQNMMAVMKEYYDKRHYTTKH